MVKNANITTRENTRYVRLEAKHSKVNNISFENDSTINNLKTCKLIAVCVNIHFILWDQGNRTLLFNIC